MNYPKSTRPLRLVQETSNERPPTYPELLKFFYKQGFQHILSASAQCVALAIIHKANELIFPDSFRMSNTELAQISGRSISNIGRLRQQVLTEVVVNETPVFTYASRGQRKAGIYRINFTITSLKLQKNFSLTSEKLPEGRDHNITKQQQNKNSPYSPIRWPVSASTCPVSA